MKKALGILIVAIAMMYAGNAMAVGAVCAAPSAEWHLGKNGERVGTYTFEWTSDSATGAVTCAAITIHGYIVRVVTDPSATAPTTLYDIVLNDALGVDVMGGTLADRSATATEQQIAQINSLNVPVRVDGTLTPVITAAGNSKIGTLKVYLQP